MIQKNSGFRPPITIKDAVYNIYNNEYILPGFQREFVWRREQIITLFDSILRGYPIGSFLFWNIKAEEIKGCRFYKFIKAYDASKDKHNEEIPSVPTGMNPTVILDGQQRLTALYIGLIGSYAYRPYRKRTRAFYPKRGLYLNLLSYADAEENNEGNHRYDLDFLPDKEVKSYNENGDNHWFDIRKVLNFEREKDVDDYLDEHITNDDKKVFANDILLEAYKRIHEDHIINYYLETSDKTDEVLNTFIRINSGGTQLTKSDLLLSIATTKWETLNARDEILAFVDEINEEESFTPKKSKTQGKGFFKKDFVITNCLVLSDLPDISDNVKNFNKNNMKEVEKKWDDIQEAIRKSIRLVVKYGHGRKTLTSPKAFIPIAYYIMKIGNPDNFLNDGQYTKEKKKIQRWLTSSLLVKYFSHMSDYKLQSICGTIKENCSEGFPLKEVIFKNSEIEAFLEAQYWEPRTFHILALLYDWSGPADHVAKDHIFARHLFDKLDDRKIKRKDQEFYRVNCNSIVNLQLLDEFENNKKRGKDFNIWLNEEYPNLERRNAIKVRHHIPLDDRYLDFNNFREFIDERKKLLKEKLNRVLEPTSD